jgi:hypothetical protein
VPGFGRHDAILIAGFHDHADTEPGAGADDDCRSLFIGFRRLQRGKAG